MFVILTVHWSSIGSTKAANKLQTPARLGYQDQPLKSYLYRMYISHSYLNLCGSCSKAEAEKLASTALTMTRHLLMRYFHTPREQIGMRWPLGTSKRAMARPSQATTRSASAETRHGVMDCSTSGSTHAVLTRRTTLSIRGQYGPCFASTAAQLDVMSTYLMFLGLRSILVEPRSRLPFAKADSSPVDGHYRSSLPYL